MLKRSIVMAMVITLLLQAGSTEIARSGGEKMMTLGVTREDIAEKGLKSRECLVVQADGTYHFERREQRLPRTNNDLEIFEGTINPDQQTELTRILSNPSLASLPDYAPPRLPISTAAFEMVTADFVVNRVQRHLGYFASVDKGMPESSPGNSPASTKRNWEASKYALRPLLSWFDRFENGNLVRVNDRETSCNR